ncbi:hypothetical protein [Clostridium ganghwense]|uniref:Binding-protein-dependent transport permease n=1 Tax=Clostridium ganghwense TaxID=312089 RepID=A0ABT4CU59_9CLOT|nr:hypothetical protein [Clostridium ganghwense]MCY6372597.1 hypothetical protein [Clostridium ganghwense]
MKKSIKALIITFIAGAIGIYLGAAIELEGYLGVILSIATMGYFIISAIEDMHNK